MKVLVAGDWHSDLHEEVVANALSRLGCEVVGFKWSPYFRSQMPGPWGRLREYGQRLQNKFIWGPLVRRLNNDFLAVAREVKPDVVFVYRGTHIHAATLARLKQGSPQCLLVGYNNDDPFSNQHASYLWRIFISAVPIYDLMLAYRHTNIPDFLKVGGRNVKLMRSWFVESRNHPLTLSDEDRKTYGSDVVFVGHYEDDGRVEYLEAVMRAGIQLRIFGHGWDDALARSSCLRSFAPVIAVWGDDYNKALCGTKVALCFLSKLNRDTYTRRCFEIPAAGVMMLSEYSTDLAALYKEGVEADFFRTQEELIFKIKYYLSNADAREAVAKAGLWRVKHDGHEVTSRMKELLAWLGELGPRAR